MINFLCSQIYIMIIMLNNFKAFMSVYSKHFNYCSMRFNSSALFAKLLIEKIIK